MTIPEQPANVSVLFVCLGNICRSPTAQGVFEKVVREHAPELDIATDSAGTHAYHVGEPPDERSQNAALRRGIDLGQQRARAVADDDFVRFDWIVAMDEDNYNTLLRRCPKVLRERVRLFMSFAPQLGCLAVPDPYYGGGQGFETVLDLTEAASLGLLQKITASLVAARSGSGRVGS